MPPETCPSSNPKSDLHWPRSAWERNSSCGYWAVFDEHQPSFGQRFWGKNSPIHLKLTGWHNFVQSLYNPKVCFGVLCYQRISSYHPVILCGFGALKISSQAHFSLHPACASRMLHSHFLQSLHVFSCDKTMVFFPPRMQSSPPGFSRGSLYLTLHLSHRYWWEPLATRDLGKPFEQDPGCKNCSQLGGFKLIGKWNLS